MPSGRPIVPTPPPRRRAAASGVRGAPAGARGQAARRGRGTIPAPPMRLVLGGAKVKDKIGVISRFLDVADRIMIGGAMAFSFFKRQGIAVGNSLVDDALGRGSGGHPRQRAAGSLLRPRAARSTSSSDGSSRPRPSGARSTASTCPMAGWALTSANGRRPCTPRRSRPRGPCSGTGPWAPSSSSRLRPAPGRSPRRWPARRARRWPAAATRSRRSSGSGSRIGSTGSPPAAARRSSSWRATSSRGSRRCSTPRQ